MVICVCYVANCFEAQYCVLGDGDVDKFISDVRAVYRSNVFFDRGFRLCGDSSRDVAVL